MNVYGGHHDAGAKVRGALVRACDSTAAHACASCLIPVPRSTPAPLPRVQVHLWDNEAGVNPHNRWRFVPVPGSADVIELQSVHNGRFVKVFGGSSDQGAPVHLWEAAPGAGGSVGQWRVVPAGDAAPAPGVDAALGMGEGAPAAAPHAASAGGAAGTGASHGTADTPSVEAGGGGGPGPGPAEGHKECIICRSAAACVALVHGDSCHVCVCVPCTAVPGSLLDKCPMCMRRVTSMLRVFT